MRSDELVAAVRVAGQIPMSDPTFTAARIRQELTDAQRQLFEKLLVNPREGHSLQQAVINTVSGTAIYRLPARSVTQGAERIELATSSSSRYVPLTKLGSRDASSWELQSGQPAAFTVRGDSVELFPTPAAAYLLRVHYYLRPGLIVDQQLIAPNTPRGRITAVNPTARTITVDVVPFDQVLEVAITSANQRIDVIRPDGGHSLVLVDATQTLAGLVFTVGAGPDLSQVAVGDYVRAAEQSDWPQLPPEFHRTLCDATAAVILLSKGVVAKAQALAGKVRSDLDRYTDLLQPRVKDQPKVLKPRYGVLRGRGLARGFGRFPS